MVIEIILESKHDYHYKSHEPYGCEKDEQAEGATWGQTAVYKKLYKKLLQMWNSQRSRTAEVHRCKR